MLTRTAAIRTTLLLILFTCSIVLHAAESVPLQPLGRGLFAVPVEVDGQPLRMLLDTGASRSLIRPRIAAALHLTPRARIALHTPAGVIGMAECGGPTSLVLGGRTLTLECIGWSTEIDLDAVKSGIDGVLAADVLASLPIHIDWNRRLLTVGPDALSVSGREVRLELVEGRPSLTLTPGAIGRRDTRWSLVVDSGASTMVLFGEAASAVSGPRVSAARVSTVSGQRRALWGMVPRLRGLQRPPRQALLLPGINDRVEDGLLPLAAVGSVAFDWRRGVAILGARREREAR